MRDARIGTTPKAKRPDDRAGPHGPGATVAPSTQPSGDPSRLTHAGGAPHIAPKPPLAKPERALQKIGFQGGIQEFNNRLQQAVDAHRLVKGFDPSPGLALDIARSPVPTDQIPGLFRYGSSRQALAASAVADAHHHPDVLKSRNDGVLERRYPLREAAEAAGRFAAGQIHPSLQARYPNVQVGMLPIPRAEEVYRTLDYLNSKGGLQGALTQQGLTLEEFQQQVKRGDGVPSDMAATAELSAGLSAKQNPTNPDLPAMRHAPLVGAALTLKDAQHALNKQMGTKLPESGYFNQDWLDALSNWMKSGDYFRKVTEQQSKDAGFGSNVGAYMKAWKSKQRAVHKNGLAAHFLNAMPLPLFGHGLVGGVKSVPGYIVHGGGDPWTVGLHALQHSAGLALDVVSGTVQQAKGDLAAGSALAHAIVPKAFGHGKTFDEAKKDAAEALRGNPTWLHALFPELHLEQNGNLKTLDEATNLVGDFLLLRKPAFTGERLAAGDVGGALKSGYVNASSHWAYQYVKGGKLAKAASMLEGGQGANRLVTVARKLIESGHMTPEQFAFHTGELYAKGRTVVTVKGKNVVVTGPLLGSLRTDKLPTPGLPGRAWLRAKNGFGDWVDSFDATLRASNYGGTDNAASFVQSVRATVQHAAPRGARGMFDETLPEAVTNFVRKHKLGDEALGQKLSSDIVRFQARENVPGLQQVQRKLERLYHEQYPISDRGQPSEFEAVLGTEAPAVFHFPGGGTRELDGALQAIDSARAKTTQALNRVASVHARLILSTGFTLFFKHAFADLGRALIGGGVAGRGAETARKEIEGLALSSPEYERRLGAFLDRTTQGETRWLLGRGHIVPSFQTSAKFGNTYYMDAAGAQLRRLLTDDAMAAYQQTNGGRDLQPLVQLVLHNDTYRGMWKAARREAYRAHAHRLGVDKLTEAQAHDVLPAEEYAAQISWRFNDFEEAATAAGVSDPFNDAVAVLRSHRGAKSDRALGKWVSDNRVNLSIESPRVEQIGSFDSITGTIVSGLMSPNKAYRKRFAENVLHTAFAELRRAGFKPDEAFSVAASLAERQVKYHMLDFVNRLQFEQDLRWLSYFATKHRLYWKWVIGALVRRPGVAAVVADAQSALDDNGNISFEVFGHKLAIPATRLVWIPGREYSEMSPLAKGGIDFVSNGGDLDAAFKGAVGTYGNVFTRVDTPIRIGIKLARMEAGNLPTTYGGATAGLDERTKARLNKAINEYQLTYFHDHGHYAPEPDAVKHVLVAQMAEEFWRSTLPLPVIPDSDPSDQQKLLRQFMAIVDPHKRRKFLEDHPGFSDHFGVYDDPKKFLHNSEMFGRFVSALDQYRAARSELLNSAKENGFTPEVMLHKRKLDAAFQRAFEKLLVEDARWAGHDVQGGQIPGVGGTPYGPWGKLAAADPQMNPRHVLNALFPKLKASEYGKVYGALQKQLQQELRLLNDSKFQASYPDPEELKARRRDILQQLEVFKGLPSDELGAVYATYQTKYVSPYWKTIDQRVNAIKELPSDERDTAYAELRAWRDKQDHEVKVDGVKFPSAVRMAWATLDPQTRRERLSYFASKNWTHLTSYEKELLTGNPVPAGLSEAYAELEKAKDTYHKTEYAPVQSDQVLAVIKQMERFRNKNGKQPYKGILADYLFSRKPLYQRLEVLPLITESRHLDAWRTLFKDAAVAHSGIASGNYDNAAIHGSWRQYVKSAEFQTFIDSHAGFRSELQAFGPDLLNTLIG